MAKSSTQAPESKRPAVSSSPQSQSGVWQSVYKSQEALDAAMNAFSKAVSKDVRDLAEARRHSETLLMREC